MADLLLIPPIAFVLYCLLVGVLSGMGKRLAGPSTTSALKSSIYAGGEPPPTYAAAPGYASFFIVALFFAMLHVGALILGNSIGSPVVAIYILGLALALLALILG